MTNLGCFRVRKRADKEVKLPTTTTMHMYFDCRRWGGLSGAQETEHQYGNFIERLGPSQIVGRQVLGTPCLGEIQLGIADRKGQLEIEVIRARALVAKPGAKILPGILAFCRMSTYSLHVCRDGRSRVEGLEKLTKSLNSSPLH